METMTVNGAGTLIVPAAQNKETVDQTTALSTELASLPSVIALNEGLRDRALFQINNRVEEIQKLDFTKLPAETITSLDAQLNELQGKGEDSIKVNNQRRSPFTKRFDAIKSIFTKAENDITDGVAKLKNLRVSLNQELHRRAQIQQQEQQRIIDKQNAEINYAKHCADCINYNYIAFVQNTILKFNNAFNAKSEADFVDYEKVLREWVPIFTKYDYDPIPSQLLTAEEMIKIRTKTEIEVFSVLSNDFVQKLSEERDRLIQLVPSRIMELKRIAEDPKAAEETQKRLANEEYERLEKLKQENQDRNEAIEATADNEKLNTLLDTVTAVPSIQLGKGAKVKLKFNVTSHKAFIAIIQWWVKNCMNLLTVEELTKKFSFMITAANKALNDPKIPATDPNSPGALEADGLFIVEDFTTRSTSK